MAHIQEIFTVKPSTIDEPKRYLGADINKIYYRNRSYLWTMGYKTYVTHDINNLKKRMAMKHFEYNNNLYYLNYTPQQLFSNLHYRP